MVESRYIAVSARLREDILSGAFSAGERLKLKDLADRYATSHMPIREALRLLNGEGLLEFHPNVGVKVREIDIDFMGDVFDVRQALEGMQARRAAKRITQEAADTIVKARKAFEAAVKGKGPERILHANHAFHSAISVAAGNREATEIEARHWHILRIVWVRFGNIAGRLPTVIQDHRQLEDAILDGDAEGAELIAAAHVIRARRALFAAMRESQSGARPKRTRRA